MVGAACRRHVLRHFGDLQSTNPDLGQLLEKLQNNGKTGDLIQNAVVREAKRYLICKALLGLAVHIDSRQSMVVHARTSADKQEP